MSTLYASHFRLREAPFSIAPNPRFLFMSEQHRDALAHLLYGIGNDGGFVLLTGEVGTGKTTLCRCLLEKVPENTDVAFIINPRLSVVDLLANICDELHIDYPKDTQSNRLLVDAINHYLLARHAEGRKTVLVVDEAQNLDADVLEQLRLLTNLETDEYKLLQIILLGQPELQDKLAQNDLRQLSQRITARYHLGPLNRADMRAYITHRLSVAGCEQEIFASAAMNYIYRQSRGIPRLINLICDRAMLGAYARGKTRIDRATAKQAAREVLGEQAVGGRRISPAWVIPGLLLMAVAAWSAVDWSLTQPPAMTPLAVQPQTASPPPVPSEPVAKNAPAIEPTQAPETAAAAATIDNTAAAQPAAASAEAKAEPATAPDTPADTAMASTAPAEPTQAMATTVEPAADTRAPDTAFLHDRQTAFASLLNAWELKMPGDFDPCAFAATRGLACLRQAGDLGLLRSLDRPAVLAWQGDDGNIAYLTLLGINGSTARAAAGDRQVDVPLGSLQQHWLGRFTILWRVPDAYRADIQPGTAGPSARWLNERLAMLDAKPGQTIDKAHIPAFYAGPWVKRLRNFQRNAGLLPDGIAGPHTLIELNTRLHAPGPRVMTAAGETATIKTTAEVKTALPANGGR